MGKYILRRLIIAFPSLLGISFILFVLLALAPGDPFGELATNSNIPPEVRQALRVKFGIDDPIFVRYARWLAILGDWAYSAALRINTTFNWGRRKLGLPYWSLSAYLKHKVKNAVQFIDNYEHAVASEARRRGVDGVVCGHIHHAEIRTIDGVLYCNDGDWVESCTALVEDFDGRLRIVHWAEEHARRQAALPRLAPAQMASE